jgi:hypothetical protein
MPMNKHLSLVLVDKRSHRAIAQDNWGLTNEQMRGKHVHHRIKRCDGGTNDPSNLYVCSEWFHNNVWHSPEEYLKWARKGGVANKGVGKKAKPGKRLGRPKGTKDSVQTRARKSLARLGPKNPRYGVTLDQELRDRIAEGNRGNKHTQTRKDHQRQKMTGRKWWVSPDGETKLCRERPSEEWVEGRVKPLQLSS